MTALSVEAEFYRQQVSGPVHDLLRHYRRFGDRHGLNPSPYFDTAFYKTTYPDWAARGAKTALDDYVAHEMQGVWRRPHPLIDPANYLLRYPDVAAENISPVGHFIRHGDAENRSPSQNFDAGFYTGCYLPLGDGLAFRHYIEKGQHMGHLPKPLVRDVSQSGAAMVAALKALDRPIILCAHDAQRAGVPLLLYDTARWYADQGFSPVFVLLNGGPVVKSLSALGPVFLLAEGWTTKGLFAAVPKDVPVIVNSGAAALIGLAATEAGLRPLILIHEMRDYLAAQNLLDPLMKAKAGGAVFAVSFPRMASALQAELGTLPIMRPGLRLPPAPLSAFREKRHKFRQQTVFIGAGHADRRKGFDLFLDAAHSIATQIPKAQFVWLGALDPWARALADAALAKGMALHLPGFVADSLAWYAAATVYLLTSRADPGPTTVFHAAATGTPFVGYAADIGLIGLTDPIGCFVEPGETSAFVAKAVALAKNDRPANRHARRAALRPHLEYSQYCHAILDLAGTSGGSAKPPNVPMP